MSTYRVYTVKTSGRIAGPPALVEADSDREALIAARRLGLALTLEVWHFARLVATLPPDHTPPPPAPPASQPAPDRDDGILPPRD